MTKEVQVKNFRILFAKKPLKNKRTFEIEVRAVSKEDALEEAYSLIGSKHRLPRQLLVIRKVAEIDMQELKSPILREIAGNDNLKLPTSK
ncbi:MAG: 50S ribosomal protein L18Ae [Candidatus Heimdallarchaeota archaeon]